MTSQPTGAGDNASLAMQNLLKHAALPHVQYSPGHAAAQQAIAAWTLHVEKFLKRQHSRIHQDPSFDLQVNQIVRELVWSVYKNRGRPDKMGFRTLSAREVVSWLDQQTQEHALGGATPDPRFADIRAAHSRVSALLRGFRVICPKHFGPMTRSLPLPCPKIHWNLGMVAAPKSEESISWLLYQEHRVDDFVWEQRRAGAKAFPHRSNSAQLDREVTACTLWYMYLIFGRLHLNGQPRLQAASPLRPSGADTQRTVLAAIAARFSAIYRHNEFIDKGRKYIQREHRDLHEALTQANKSDAESH